MGPSVGRRIVGREREYEDIATVMTNAAETSGILTLVGEPGSGKSTLLEAAVDLARDGNATLLHCAPTEAETVLPYAALGDLLAPVADLSVLPGHLRRALDRALLRDDHGADTGDDDTAEAIDVHPLDARVIGQALTQLLGAFAQTGIVVLVIDDLQWLDQASGAALAFALRRVPAAGVAVIAARRPDVIEWALPGQVLELQALTDTAIESIVGEWTHLARRSIPLRRRRQIVDAARGNPLFAIELARAQLAAQPGRPADATVPATLSSLLSARFGHLDPDVSDALATIALLGRADLAAARRLGIVEQITNAERDGVVDVSTGRIVFTHPLFATAVVERLPSMSLRASHRRLADVVDDPAEAARHAALAAEAPDGPIAAALIEHAESFAARAALGHASDLAALAVQTSPLDDPLRPGYCVRAAELAFRSGDTSLGARLLDQVGDVGMSSCLRVAALLLRSRIAFESGEGSPDALAAEALEHCTTDIERVEALTVLARGLFEDHDQAARRAGEALELAERTPVAPLVLASALTAKADTQMLSGRGLARSLYTRAIALEQGAAAFTSDSAYGSFAVMLKTCDELDEAREMLLTILRSDADDGAVPFVLSHLPQLELWAGNWDLAEEYALRHLDAALRTGQHDQVLQARFNRALIDVRRGDVTTAVVVADELERDALAAGSLWTERNAAALRGLIALSQGDAAAAVISLSRYSQLGDQFGLREPGYVRLQADLVEALVATGDLGAAADLVEVMSIAAERLDRPGARATAWRVGALVAAASGDHQSAVRRAADAVALYATTPLVFEHARSLLTLGQVHRRFKEKAAARDALQAALAAFQWLGGDGFAERARLDLARVGLRPASSTSLTETERRVARAAATGRTVRQVGDELFISAKTVEANLTRVYRKLRISGRAELAAWVAAGEPDPHD